MAVTVKYYPIEVETSVTTDVAIQFLWPVRREEHLVVTANGVLVPDSQMEIRLSEQSQGGTVTIFGQYLRDLETPIRIRVERRTPLEQPDIYSEYRRISNETLESSLDNLAMQIQEVEERGVSADLIEDVRKNLRNLQNDLTAMQGQLTTAESSITRNSDDIALLRNDVEATKLEVTGLIARADQIESDAEGDRTRILALESQAADIGHQVTLLREDVDTLIADGQDLWDAVDQLVIDKIDDAPRDGNQYARQDGNWSVVTGGGGSAEYPDGGAPGDLLGQDPVGVPAWLTPAQVVASLPFASSSNAGTVKPDNVTTFVTDGVLTAVGGGSGNVFVTSTNNIIDPNTDETQTVVNTGFRGRLSVLENATSEFITTPQAEALVNSAVAPIAETVDELDTDLAAVENTVSEMGNTIAANFQTIDENMSDLGDVLATKIDDAPHDGTVYGRSDGEWVGVEGGSSPSGEITLANVIGQIIDYYGPVTDTSMFEPDFIYADGRAVSRVVFARLFEVIGTTYGEGDGSMTFNVPDLRGLFTRGLGGASAALGERQGDAIRNITGTVTWANSIGLLDRYATSSGAFKKGEKLNIGLVANSDNRESYTVNMDASLAVPTADENRPVNMACHKFIVARASTGGTKEADTPLPWTIGQLVPHMSPMPNPDIFMPTMVYADGRELLRDEYPELFAAYGTTYGVGDGTTTFGLPDLRGLFLRGLDAGRGLDPDRVLGELQGDAIRNITGEFGAGTSTGFVSSASSSGAFEIGSADRSTVIVGSSGSGNQMGFDASNVVPTADENRPVNMPCNWLIFAKSPAIASSSDFSAAITAVNAGLNSKLNITTYETNRAADAFGIAKAMARVDLNGTITVSKGFVSCVRTSTGNYVLTLASGLFSNVENMIVIGQMTREDAYGTAINFRPSEMTTTQVVARTFQTNGSTPDNLGFALSIFEI